MTLASIGDELIPIVAIVFGCLIAITSMIVKGVRAAAETRQREQSRREIAAYVAEGSMTPEQGERLLAVGQPPKDKD
ncbi:MAG: hypothetical protein JNJ48_07595 [Phycisphaerae bacterium]|nr:hypothetical protein [Phycisphaerae bacterium]